MRKSEFHGVHEDAFSKKLKTQEYDGCVDGEIVTENWYRLSIEDARRFIDDAESVERKVERGYELPDPWIKLITCEHRNTATRETRRYWSISLRPYIQGYGCDGSTDLNIHAIANRLAERQGIDYPSLLRKAYPEEFPSTADFSWLDDVVVLAETIIPKEVDADLALRDLEEINNYTLAMELGIELRKVGAVSTDWAEIRKTQEVLKKEIERDVHNWFERHDQSTPPVSHSAGASPMRSSADHRKSAMTERKTSASD